MSILDIFARDKSPGPDGWPTEFFLHFFYLLGGDLVKIVEESRRRGFIPEDLNATYLDLISKKDKPTSFDDYRLISLFNLAYKLISKVIANMMKPFL